MTVLLPPDAAAGVRSVLESAQARGFLGPGPVEPHITRALAFARALPSPPPRALDLGSGGGLPGLPLALYWTATRWVLLDGSQSRAAFLEGAVATLGLAGRVTVLAARAEDAGRGPLRGTLDLVVARSFASPAVTAECAAPFLRPGGHLVVAEPPGGDLRRWDAAGLAILGLAVGPRVPGPTALQVLRCERPCPDRFPRRVGIPAKRPLFGAR